jgi:fructose-1,6-bisphosphatase II / sedoheptulose-1,7-bisphosphatase
MHCAEPALTGIDMYMGSGGAPEGVLAASALKCMGGQMYGPSAVPQRLMRKQRAAKAGITDLDRVYTRDEMVTDDCNFRSNWRDRRLNCIGHQA